MARFFAQLVEVSTGRLLWLNLAVLVALKVAVPLGSLGLASITEILSLPDGVAIVSEINAQRRASGVGELSRSRTLDLAAERKMDDMESRGYFAHVSPAGVQAWDFMSAEGYRYRTAGENLARGFADPAQLVGAWMQSPSHRANVVGSAYRETGVAVRRITLDGKPATVVVQLFGAPSGAAAPPVALRTPVPAVSPVTAPQRVTTNTAVAPVAAPIPVTQVAGAAAAPAQGIGGAVFAGYLGLVLVLLTAAAGWVGFHRRHAVGWLAHAGLIALLVALPQIAPSVSRFIY